MSTLAKVFVVLNLLLAVAFLGSAATILGNQDAYKAKLEQERKDHAGVLAERDRTINDQKAANANLVLQKNEASTAMAAARAEADARKSTMDMMAAEATKLSAAYEAASKALLIAQNTIKEGRTLADQLQTERQTLLKRVGEAEDTAIAAVKMQNKLELDMENATAQIQDQAAKLKDCQDQNDRLRFRLEAAERSGAAVPTGEQPAQRAKVMAADNEANVVVISIGAEDGVKVGFTYTISRGNSYVATLKIMKVDAKLSSGSTSLGKGPVQVNDDVMNAR